MCEFGARVSCARVPFLSDEIVGLGPVRRMRDMTESFVEERNAP
jgi:hypothetical protein